MDWTQIEASLAAISAAMGDLSQDDLEELAIRASEIRQQAWTIRAQKIQVELGQRVDTSQSRL